MPQRILALGAALVVIAFAADAAEQFPLNIVVDGSLPFQYESNPTHAPTNKQPDNAFSPFLKLSVLGDLRPDLSYSFYAATSVNQYLQSQDNTGSMAALGTQVIKRWGPLQLGAFYDRSYNFDNDFGTLANSNNDFGGFIRYLYTTPTADFKIKPGVTMTTRLDDSLAVQRYLYSFKIDFEHKLVDRWWVVLTPRLRLYDYVNTELGHTDLIASISTGLKYDISQNATFTTLVGYENRTSNLDGRGYNNVFIGASLDFSYTLFAPRGSGAKSDFLQWMSR